MFLLQPSPLPSMQAAWPPRLLLSFEDPCSKHTHQVPSAASASTGKRRRVAEPQRRLWPGMERVPGHPSSRPDEEYSVSICTPGMEQAVSEMRRTHLGILISDPRLNISTRSIGKALQDKLGFDWADIHVMASYPDDFLVRFEHPWQRDMALELGSVPLKHGSMALMLWSPTARGCPRTWRFYCRLALESLPLSAWEETATIKAVLGGACELDRIERRSVSKDNTAAFFVWVWCLDPDLIPRVKAHTILNRQEAGREGLPEGTPSEDGRDGPLFRVLVHLDIVLDYTPVDESRRRHGQQWPNRIRHDWEFGVKDGDAAPRRCPVRDRLGPSSHHCDDENRREDRDARLRRLPWAWASLGGSRRTGPWQGRSCFFLPWWCSHHAFSGGRSRTPEGSLVMGGTPSPPRGQLGGSNPGSPMVYSPPPQLWSIASDVVQLALCSPSTEQFDMAVNGVPAPPSPQIPWAASTAAAASPVALHAFTDAWSANIVPEVQEQRAGEAADAAAALAAGLGDGWGNLLAERSGEHIPSLQAIEGWSRDWVDNPAGMTRHIQGFDELLLQQPPFHPGGRFFGPGCQELSPDLLQADVGTPVSEGTLYEVGAFGVQAQNGSVGWQLQDIFNTPPQPPQPPSPELSSDDIDDDKLFEVTLKLNALRALRDANLCGKELMEDVTTRVAGIGVDPKRTFMSKVVGMFSHSLLRFPTNSPQKKKGAKKILSMPSSSRRSDRPATRTATMMTNRRAQAAACKQMGLIRHENELNDEILAQYISCFQQPLTQEQVLGLGLTEAFGRPGFVLPEKDMADMLRESPFAE